MGAGQMQLCEDEVLFRQKDSGHLHLIWHGGEGMFFTSPGFFYENGPENVGLFSVPLLRRSATPIASGFVA
jgi:hypothetical protein